MPHCRSSFITIALVALLILPSWVFAQGLKEKSAVFYPETDNDIVGTVREDRLPYLLPPEERVELPLQHTLSLDLFRSLTDFFASRDDLAQRNNERILATASSGSRTYAEAALLSGLEFYAHTPLRTADVQAGLDRLSLVHAEALPDEVRPELHFWKAEGLRALGQDQGAEEEYKLARDATSSISSLASFRLAELFERERRRDSAAESFRQVRNDSQSVLRILASIRRAAVLRDLERYPEVLSELSIADSLLSALPTLSRTSARNLGYESELVSQLLLKRTENERLVGRAPDREPINTVAQLTSPYVGSEIALLRGTALLETGKYTEGEKVLQRGVAQIVGTQDSLGIIRERLFLRDALHFELAWSHFLQAQYDEAAKEFLELASQDTTQGRFFRKRAGSSLREQGRFADPFFEEAALVRTTNLDKQLFDRTTIDTSYFIYNDYPERSRFYAGVALARAGKLRESQREFEKLSADRALLYSDKSSYQLGLLYFRQKNYVQAGLLLEPLVYDRSTTGAFASFLMGEMSYRKHSFERAQTYFTNALLGLSNDSALHAVAHLERGLSMVSLENWNDAIEDLTAYLQLSNYTKTGLTDEAMFWLAKSYFRVKNYDSARAIFERVLREYPNTERRTDAVYGYAWSLFQQNEFAAAGPEFERVIALDSITRYAYDALARSADAQYAQGNLLNANKILNAAVDRPAFNEYRTTRALYQLGVTRIMLDSARSALNVFSHLVTKFPNSDLVPDALFNGAVAAYAINLPERSEENVNRLKTSFAQSPLAPRALLLAGNERLRKDDQKGSLQFFQTVLTGYSTSSEAREALVGMQDALIALKRVPEALAVGDSLVARNPAFAPEVLLRKGSILLTAKQPTESAVAFDEFIARYPTRPEVASANVMSGRAWLASGDTAKAIGIFTRVAREYDSSDAAPNALLELARISRRRGEIGRASEYYAHAYDLRYYSSEAAPQAMTEYGQLLLDEKQPDSAIAVLNELTNRYLVDTRVGSRAQLKVAQILMDHERYDEARVALRRVAEVRDDVLGGAARVRLGETYLAESAWREAAEEFVKAKRDYKVAPESEIRRLLGLASAYQAVGRKAEAITALKSLLAMSGVPSKDRVHAQAMLDVLSPKKAKKAAKPKAPAKGGKKR